MSELRLVPGAVAVWALTIILLLTGSAVWAGLALLAGSLVLAWCRQAGQALLFGVLGVCAIALTWWRQRLAAAWTPPSRLLGTVSGSPVEVESGGHLVRIDAPGHPAPLPVFTDLDGRDLPAGSHVVVEVNWSATDRPGLGALVGNGELQVSADPHGMDLVAWTVRQALRGTVDQTVGEASRGLVPGMVLGDVSAQTSAERQLYIDTGLSHLSAVSGANVAIVTTVAVIGCRLLTLGPRVQVAAATVALLGFVGLVGTEPSVLRAALTGLVGLLAVLGSSRMEPIHGLCLAVIGLVLWDPDLAVSYGFALSVAATAGIIALHPLLYRPLARTRLPDIFVRALAVAVSADIVTMPIIALMAGEVSVVSVLANVMVAPAVAPVTLLGLPAAGLALLPGPLAWLPLKLLEPCTWWIHTVAAWCAGLPLATVSADPVWVLVAYGWIIAGLVGGHPWKTLVLVTAWWVWSTDLTSPPAEVPLESLQLHVVDEVEEVDRAPPGTQVIIVRDPTGSPADRPSITRDRVPVLFPHRDGVVSLHVDGTQHARDGRF
ncbi:ComEC/Rec2 family competence protein [Corynebacterium comes]|uniref:ComEC family competence protein n=1 Tax=Corynebacterium comes TaxID=2675218 RepID=A0A6B8VQC5_9CORY|nr:ComEC/Rec2 family competence protein [Corynebacterium comes]QGU05259.1 ComEC family competence protein [Corynebacterium comes]